MKVYVFFYLFTSILNVKYSFKQILKRKLGRKKLERKVKTTNMKVFLLLKI